MRVLVVDTYYPAFLVSHYAAAPGLAASPYDRQWRALMDRFFGTSDAYFHHLRALGHEAQEVVYNCEPLQSAWWSAQQRGVRGWIRRAFRRDAVLLDQANAFEADVVYVQDLWALAPETLRRLGRGRLLVGQIASELPHPDQLSPFDLVVTSFPHFAESLPHGAYLPLAFDERVLSRLDPARERAGAVFVGSLHPAQHGRGTNVLAAAAAAAGIELYGPRVDAALADAGVARQYRGEAWGLDMYRVLAAAAVSVNRHIDVAGRFANNMRLYESTGVGALLLTDEKDNLAELFEPGVEVVTYRDADELVHRVRHYLAHEDERAAIAAAGQQRTLRDHTWRVRIRELATLLEGRL